MRFECGARDPNQKGTLPHVKLGGWRYHRTLLLRRLLDGRRMALQGLPTTNARSRTVATRSNGFYSLHQRFDHRSHVQQAARRENARLVARPSTLQRPAPLSRGTLEDQELHLGIQTTRANDRREAVGALRHRTKDSRRAVGQDRRRHRASGERRTCRVVLTGLPVKKSGLAASGFKSKTRPC